jgi:hypothetical protein
MDFTLYGDNDAFEYANLYFTLGMNLESGIGFGAQLTCPIQPKFDLKYIDVLFSYTAEAFELGLDVTIPIYENGLDAEGLGIGIDFDYNINENLTVYLSLPIGGIAKKVGDPVIGLIAGLKYSF